MAENDAEYNGPSDDPLLAALDKKIAAAIRNATDAFEGGDMKSVSGGLEAAQEFLAIRRRLAMQSEISRACEQNAKSGGFDLEGPPSRVPRRRPLRTPKAAFFTPILQLLFEWDGPVLISDILPVLQSRMSAILNRTDMESAGPGTNCQVWERTARWAAITLSLDGFVKQNSNGTWTLAESSKARMLAEAVERSRQLISDSIEEICAERTQVKNANDDDEVIDRLVELNNIYQSLEADPQTLEVIAGFSSGDLIYLAENPDLAERITWIFTICELENLRDDPGTLQQIERLSTKERIDLGLSEIIVWNL